MKSKKEKDKPLQPCLNYLQTEPFWRCHQQSPEARAEVEAWFAENQKDIKLLLKDTVSASVAEISRAMGMHCHLSFEQREEDEQRHGLFDLKNYKLDFPSLKVLIFVLSSKAWDIHTFKFTNNCFDFEQCKALQAYFSAECKATHIVYDWNPPGSQSAFSLLYRFIALPKLQSLTLRCCKLGVNAAGLIKKLAEKETACLRLVDLSNNELGQESVEAICNLIRNNRSLLQLGLSHNRLSSNQSMNHILSELGCAQIKQQDIALIKEIQHHRDEVVEHNKRRRRGAPEQPVPKVPKLVTSGNLNRIQLNTVLQCVNFGCNRLHQAQSLAELHLSRCVSLVLIFNGNLTMQQNRQLSQKFGERFLF